MSREDLRQQYTMGGLEEAKVPNQPLPLFTEWLQTAVDYAPSDWVEPYAMTLATSMDANVTARIVLLRGFDEEGFVFYTNYESAKGKQLNANPNAALVFYWGYLERQVRITGSVTCVSREFAEKYFHKRPRGSQIGASVSRQSTPLKDRQELEAKVQEFEAQMGDETIPLPTFWGGFRVHPREIEFWQGRQNRLHDRLVYHREAVGSDWNMKRLSP